MRRAALALLQALMLAAAATLGLGVRDPALAAARPWPLIGALAATLALLAVARPTWPRSRPAVRAARSAMAGSIRRGSRPAGRGSRQARRATSRADRVARRVAGGARAA